MADIKYTVTIDASTGAAEIKKLEGEFDKLAGTTKKSGEEAEKAGTKHGELGSQIGKLMLSLTATLGIVELSKRAWASFTGNLKDSVRFSMDQEDADMALRSSLAITGREVNLNTKHFQDYASQIQRTTIFADDQVQTAQALLLQLTKLDREGIDQATRGAIGLASALGIDLQSAAMMVAKAMEGNYAALARYGIRVDENLSATEKQAALLNKLEAMYRRATDAVDTYGGSLKRLKNSISEVQEAFGNFVTQNPHIRIAIKEATEGADALAERFKYGEATLKDWVAMLRLSTNIFGDVGKAAILARVEINNLSWAVDRNKKSFGDALPDWQSADEWLLRLAGDAAKARGGFSGFGDTYSFIPSIKTLGQTEIGMQRVRHVTQGLIADLGETLPGAHRHLVEVYEKGVGIMAGGAQTVKKAWADISPQIEQTVSMFGDLFGGLASLSRANTERRLDDLDQYYEAQKQMVADSLMTEQQKADALKVLDEKHEIARKNLARSAAKDEKSYSVFQAIISTAAAVINAMTAKPFGPWNFIQAALVAAMGAVQVATIKAQPIPLATGFEGVVRQPTLFVAGEAGPEHLSVRPEKWGNGGRIIHVHQHIYFGGQKIKEQILEIIERASGEGTLKIRAKAIQ